MPGQSHRVRVLLRRTPSLPRDRHTVARLCFIGTLAGDWSPEVTPPNGTPSAPALQEQNGTNPTAPQVTPSAEEAGPGTGFRNLIRKRDLRHLGT